MSAYRGGFLEKLSTGGTSNLGVAGSISPSLLDFYETLMAGDEIVTTLEGDEVEGKSRTVHLQLSVDIGTVDVAPDGQVVITPITPANTDPLWAYVTLLADFNIPTGATMANYPPRPTESGAYPSFPTLDYKLSQCSVSGGSGSDLYPIFGNNTVGSMSVVCAVIGWPGTGLLDDNIYDPTTHHTRNQRLFESDFTVEGWDLVTGSAYLSDAGLGIILTQYISGAGQYSILSSLPKNGDQGYLGESFGGTNVSDLTLNKQQFTYLQPLDVWTHVCLERYNGVITLYADGVAKASITSTKKFFGTIHIGHYHGPRRITQDTARYKGTFTPPIAPFEQGYPAPSSIRVHTP